MQYIAYYRVSTDKQGIYGLGMEAQTMTVAAYVARTGGEIVGEYTEVESGANKDRPQLKLALRDARQIGAKLIVAKLDRLARDFAFVANLLADKRGPEFVACDMPEANRLMIHIMAAVAEYERHLISERTKAGLAVAKSRGVRLGNPQMRTEAMQRRMTAARRQKFIGRRAQVRAVLAFLSANGAAPSYSQLALALEERGIYPERSKTWTDSILERYLR